MEQLTELTEIMLHAMSRSQTCVAFSSGVCQDMGLGYTLTTISVISTLADPSHLKEAESAHRM